MEMESPRRPFDRSREPGLKKPRLTEDAVALDRSSNGRSSFIQRPATSGSAGSRFRVSERGGGDSESSDSVRGPYPQPLQQHQELVNQYKTALAELTFNSKPIITNLTIIAGENLHAAKAIAATVCANILEVPREQKLPSLYLLDSIVKNIGRDYIKYFAARLPEVFCKAYKQVDPSIHPGMRHLFGTWKGVFPHQPLHMIEKELGFGSAVNGSSSGTTSRSDAPVARTAPSIHVNPKYLEARHHFQQSSRAKGGPSDVIGNIVNSSNAEERLERTHSVTSGRQWADPSVKNNQRPQREQLTNVHKRNITAAYVDSEYDSDNARHSGLETGRASEKFKEQTLDKSWLDSGNVTGRTSNQRNGFGANHGFQGYPAVRSSNSTGIQPIHSFNSQSITGMTGNWKNSEEEEYVWDDMNSRLTDRGVVTSSGRDCWTPDDSERTSEASADSLATEPKGQAVFGSHISSSWSKEQHHSEGMGDFLSARDIAAHSEIHPTSLSGLPMAAGATGRTSFQPKIGSGNIGMPGHVLPTKATLGSTAMQSPLHQRPPSPSFKALTANQVVNHPAEQDLPQLKPGADSRTLFSRQLNNDPRTQFNKDSLPLPSQNVHLTNQRLQSPNIRGLPSITPSAQSRNHASSSLQRDPEAAVSESSQQPHKPLLPQISGTGESSITLDSLSAYPKPLVVQSSGQSNTSSLLAAVVSSGILGGHSVTGSFPHLSSQDEATMSKRPPLPSGPPPIHLTSLDPRISPHPSSQPSIETKSSSSTFSPRSAEPPPLPPGPPSPSLAGSTSSDALKVADVSTPMSSLLSSLVAKGLISASKTESSTSITSQIPARLQNQNPASITSQIPVRLQNQNPASITSQIPAPLQNQNPEVACSSSAEISPAQVSLPCFSSSSINKLPSAKPVPKSPDLPQSTGADVKNQIGFQFKPDVLRELHPSVISELFDDLPHNCSICGLRLKFQDRLDRHLQWHSLRNRNKDLDKATREWYTNSVNWIKGDAGSNPSNESGGLTGGSSKRLECKEQMVPADESQCLCILCGELFEDFYDQEMDQWMFRGAVYITIPSSEGETGNSSDGAAQGSIVHANCVSKRPSLDLELAMDVKLEKHP